MDVSCFDTENFDEVEYVNELIGSFKSSGSSDSLESHMKTEKLKLEMKAMSLTQDLDRTRLSLTGRLPETSAHIQLIVIEASKLREQINTWSRDMSAKEAEAEEDAIAVLSNIDSTKNRMEEALQILLQADALSDKSAKLMKEFGATGPNLESVPVPQLLDMASHLSEVQKYSSALSRYPLFAKYQHRIEQLQQQLEQAARPRLLLALTENNIQEAKNIYDVYVSIDMEAMFQSHILQERHKIVVELWDSYQTTPGSHPAGFGDWLVSFYDQLERILSQSVKISDEISSNGFYRATLLLIHSARSYKQSMESQPERLPSQSLPELVQSFDVTKEFLTRVKSSLEVDQLGAFGENLALELEEAVLAPFFNFQLKYGDLEKTHLLQQLRRLAPFTTVEEVEKIPPSILKIEWCNDVQRDLHAALGNLDGATARCFGLTDWGGASSLFVVVFDILAEYTQQFSRLLKSLRTASGLPSSPSSIPSVQLVLSSLSLEKLSRSTKPSDPPSLPQEPPSEWDQLTHSGLELAASFLRCLADVQFHLNSYCDQLLSDLVSAGEIFRDGFSSSMLGSSLSMSGVPDMSEFPCAYLRNQPASCRKVVSFFETIHRDGGGHDRFVALARSLHSLRKGILLFVFDVVFGFIRSQLEGLCFLPVWSLDDSPAMEQTDDAEEVRLPQFSISPSSYVHHIKEFLLHLYQALQPLSVTPLFCGFDFLNEKGDFHASLKSGHLDTKRDDSQAEEFVLQWMEGVVNATSSLYLDQILRVPKFSKRGCEQMRMDIQCFQSILSLMNISFDPATDWALKFLEPDADIKKLREECPPNLRKIGDRIQHQLSVPK